jgi:ComF family protein
MPSLRLIAHLSALGRSALDLLVPSHCPLCDEIVDAEGLFCARCFRRIEFVTDPVCTACGVMFAYAGQAGAGSYCSVCLAARPAFSRTRAAFRYDTHARKLILQLKHADRIEFSRVLTAHMIRAGAALLREADLLVPVPLHRRRLFQRRYNQAALLASGISRTTGVAVLPDGLARRRKTEQLGHKKASERHESLVGAFAVRPHRIRDVAGRRIVLVDDVMTSGATANECAVALKAAGAVSVTVLVAARVPDPRLS